MKRNEVGRRGGKEKEGERERGRREKRMGRKRKRIEGNERDGRKIGI